MFATPPVIETTVFARVPEALSRADRRSPWVDLLRDGASTPSFLEGPSFDRDGNLWVTDIPWGRLFKITPEGRLSVALEYDGEPNGLKFHRDGRAFITDHKHGLMVFDPKTGEIAPHRERGVVERFKGVNDLVFTANGDIYFTDQGQSDVVRRTGRLFRWSEARGLELLLDECRATIAETQENLRVVRASLERLLMTTGDVKDLAAQLNRLRAQIGPTLEASRRRH